MDVSWLMTKTIRLNCLFFLRTLSINNNNKNISGHSITMLKITTNETFDKLRTIIRNRWAPFFTNINLNNFIINKADTGATTKISDQIEYYNVEGNEIDKKLAIFPYELISDHFPVELPSDKIHIIVEF